MNDNNELIKDNLKNIKEKNNREAKKKKSDKSKSVLKEGLIKQLEQKGYTLKDNPYIFDKLEDYVTFFKIKNALIQDLEDRGLVVEWNNSETSRGEKLNESLSMFLKVDTQMLKILNFLDLKPTQNLKEDDDDEPL